MLVRKIANPTQVRPERQSDRTEAGDVYNASPPPAPPLRPRMKGAGRGWLHALRPAVIEAEGTGRSRRRRLGKGGWPKVANPAQVADAQRRMPEGGAKRHRQGPAEGRAGSTLALGRRWGFQRGTAPFGPAEGMGGFERGEAVLHPFTYEIRSLISSRLENKLENKDSLQG